MNPRIPSLLALLAAALAGPAADSTASLRHAVLARGDFNGDGRLDIAWIERDSGQIRVAHRGADGALDWGQTHQTGIAPVTGLSVGRHLQANRDALALTGTWSNRANVFDLSNLAVLSLPLPVFSTPVGPCGVASAQVAGGNALEELVLFHTENGVPPHARAYFRFAGTPLAAQSYAPTLPQPAVGALEWRPRRLEGLGIAAVGLSNSAAPASDTFRILRVAPAPLQYVASLPGLPPGSEFLHADFDGNTTPSPAQFVFWKPGAPTLHWSSLSEALAFSAPVSFDTGADIEHVSSLRSAGGRHLLVVFSHGGAAVFSFNGLTPPVAGEVFPAPADGHAYQAAFVPDSGDFHLLAGPPGRPATRAERFTWDGVQHAPNGQSALPPVRSARASANLFAFTQDPFVTTGAVLLGSFSAGEWTREGKVEGGQLQAEAARFQNASVGLGPFQALQWGSAPAGTTHVMSNQIPSGQAGVPSYASAFGPSPALGLTLGEIGILPPPGKMLRSIRPSFQVPPGVQVFWRMGNGAWTALATQSPGWQYRDFTIQWHGRNAAGTTSPISQATYTFAEGPSDMDSDGDGVPDYVEIALGLDPVASGDDADGDGASDLLEILSGTDPNDPNDFPTRANGPAGTAAEFDGNYRNTFAFRITPISIAGSSRYATLGAEGTGMSLNTLAGSRLAYAISVGGNPQQARFGNIQAAFGDTVLVAGTDANFDLTASAPMKRRGRELVGLIPVPAVQLGPVPHAYTGAPLQTAAQEWIAAAKIHYSQAFPPALHQLDSTTGLRLLLVERKLEAILRERGEILESQRLSLTPFRPTERTWPLASREEAPPDAVFHLDAAGLDGLRRPLPPYALGWRVGDLDAAIGAALDPPATTAISLLLQVAREIHFLSAAADETTLPQFPSPVDSLRRFLRHGRLPGDLNEDGILDADETLGYWPAFTLTPAQLAQAHGAVATLLALPPSRPTASGVFVVDGQTFDTAVPVVRDRNTLAPHVLLQGNGEPWPLAQFARLVSGAELTVTGFTDVQSPHAPDAWEVIHLSLTQLPVPGTLDQNNNLIGDAYESLFAGIAIDGPFTDTDGDGYTDLEEYLNGSDPTDTVSVPASPPQILGPPQIELTDAGAGGGFTLEFFFPEAYASLISFHLQHSDSLEEEFEDVGLVALHVGGGLFRISLQPAQPSKFWRFRLSLD